ncbi:MAG TPA: hypothetical protein VEC06_19725 [Paucimonas sp.]|nr:hypothetical protein [Paucimonas sp.]
MLKYEFSLQTRDGQRVDGIAIMGADQADAERKLRQMYRQCEVLRCDVKQNDERQRPAASVEDLLSLISKEF